MAYADYPFYTASYHGDVLTAENANKWLGRASDELDNITFRRLENGFPEDANDALRVRKAVCALAEALYFIDEQSRAALAQKNDDGQYMGAVSSVKSGAESISYASPGSATGASAYAAAASSPAAKAQLIRELAASYVANTPDRFGTNLLYAGAEPIRRRCSSCAIFTPR